jgi:septum formation protein
MLILASSSPQRRAILERLGVSFAVVAPGVQELAEGDATEVAKENALRKAKAVAITVGSDPVLGADTVVAISARGGDREPLRSTAADAEAAAYRRPLPAEARAILGKPGDEREAREMLTALSGRTHTVVGGLALLVGSRERLAAAHTHVSFRALDEPLLTWYLATGEWRGRAGAYAIQGAGAALVREVRGDYENVVGLPLATLLDIYPELLPA